MGKRAHGEGSIFERKDGLWAGAITVGYTQDGRQKRRTVYGRTQGEAREKLDELKRQVALGTLPSERVKVGEYLEEWLAHKEDTVKARTIDDYTYICEQYIGEQFGGRYLDKVRPMHVQNLVRAVSKGVSADRANKVRRVLFSAMKQAVRWQLIPRNPVEAVAPLKVERKPMTLWTAKEASKFLDTARGDRYYALFYLAMSTGLRCGELLGLHWDDLDLAHARLRVRRSLGHIRGKLALSTPKTKKGERLVALMPDVVDVMLEHHTRQDAERRDATEWRRSELVFPSEVGDYTDPNNFSRRWRALQVEAEVRKIRLHDLRHLHASIAIRAGVDPKVLADRLGHARASFTLDVYTHLFDEQREAAAVSVQSLIGTKAEPS